MLNSSLYLCTTAFIYQILLCTIYLEFLLRFHFLQDVDHHKVTLAENPLQQSNLRPSFDRHPLLSFLQISSVLTMYNWSQPCGLETPGRIEKKT